MKLKNFIILSLFLISAGCSKKDDFKDNNKAPQIEFSKPNNLTRVGEIKDTIKVNWLYYVNVFIQDEDKNIKPIFTWESDTIPVTQSDTAFPIHYAALPNNDTTFEFQVTKDGSYTIEVTATDSYGASKTSLIELYVVINAAPSIHFTVENSKVLDPLEITIDASASYDPDAKWGGKIVEYEYIINNAKTIDTPLSKISYIVDAPGNYLISVRAMDNDGAWSLVSSKYLNVTNN